MLEQFGLTKGESQVYLALLTLGSSTTGPIAKESGISASKVYKVLDRLEKKGLVGNIIKGKTKYFDAVDPKRLTEYLDTKEQQVQEERKKLQTLLPQLESLKKESIQNAGATLFQGYRAVTNQILLILDELKEGEAYAVLSANNGETLGIQTFFENFHRQRVKKGIRARMLATVDLREEIKNLETNLAQIKYLPSYLKTNMQIMFYKETSLLIIWLRTPIGFLIQGKDARDSFEAYFDAFWKVAKE